QPSRIGENRSQILTKGAGVPRVRQPLAVCGAPKHMPESGPVVLRTLETRHGMGYIDPTKEVFAQFKANDRAGPIHMLNLVRLRQQAAYPDGRKATGAEAY